MCQSYLSKTKKQKKKKKEKIRKGKTNTIKLKNISNRTYYELTKQEI